MSGKSEKKVKTPGKKTKKKDGEDFPKELYEVRPFKPRPRVVIQFNDDVMVPFEDLPPGQINDLALGPIKPLLEDYPGLTFKPLFGQENESTIKSLVQKARRMDPSYDPPNFFAFFFAVYQGDGDAQALADELSSWPTVSLTYVSNGPGLPGPVSTQGDPNGEDQSYLKPAPEGIDAKYAWEVEDTLGISGGDGAGQALVDIEQGWWLQHEDLVDHGITPITAGGGSYWAFPYHGTSVLGIIAATDHPTSTDPLQLEIGCVGITPNLAQIRVEGLLSHQYDDNWSHEKPVTYAIEAMKFGDVLLLEVVDKSDKVPWEIEPAVFHAIRLASALGLVVIEPAGSKNEDLDNREDPDGKKIFQKGHTEFRDSGAIMVGAAADTADDADTADIKQWHHLLGGHGSRIDCFAMGDGVVAPTYGGPGAPASDHYTDDFGGTSAASAIVAGAALAVQGLAQGEFGYRLSPGQIRQILGDLTEGRNTKPADDEEKKIGVMPNLQAIIDNVLKLTPDLYLRDHVGDTGDPHTGPISSSPDIIVRNSPVTGDLQLAFGEGSGTENSVNLSDAVEVGQDNYIYVRTRNRGGAEVDAAGVKIYYARASTLVSPDQWKEIGTATFGPIQTGDQLTVSNVLKWERDDIPGTGHYCFIGIIGSTLDPATLVPSMDVDFNIFRRFIRENNNVTWRNFNVVDNIPDPPDAPTPAEFLSLDFLSPGARDKNRPMALEVISRLPRGSKLLLEVPEAIAQELSGPRGLLPSIQYKPREKMAYFHIQPYGGQRLPEIHYPVNSLNEMRLLVQIPEQLRGNEYEVAVRQLYNGEEMGRVTWRLVPKK